MSPVGKLLEVHMMHEVKELIKAKVGFPQRVRRCSRALQGLKSVGRKQRGACGLRTAAVQTNVTKVPATKRQEPRTLVLLSLQLARPDRVAPSTTTVYILIIVRPNVSVLLA